MSKLDSNMTIACGNTHTHMHTHTHAHTHTQMHTHAHTCTHASYSQAVKLNYPGYQYS